MLCGEADRFGVSSFEKGREMRRCAICCTPEERAADVMVTGRSIKESLIEMPGIHVCSFSGFERYHK